MEQHVIRFTRHDNNGSAVYLNSAHVVSVRPTVPDVAVIQMLDGTTWTVSGSANKVVEWIEKAR